MGSSPAARTHFVFVRAPRADARRPTAKRWGRASGPAPVGMVGDVRGTMWRCSLLVPVLATLQQQAGRSRHQLLVSLANGPRTCADLAEDIERDEPSHQQVMAFTEQRLKRWREDSPAWVAVASFHLNRIRADRAAFEGLRWCTMSRSNVEIGAPASTASTPSTTMNYTSCSARAVSVSLTLA